MFLRIHKDFGNKDPIISSLVGPKFQKIHISVAQGECQRYAGLPGDVKLIFGRILDNVGE